MTADEKMREAFEKQHEGYEFPSRDFKDAALNNFADGWYAHQKQAAQQVQVSEDDIKNLCDAFTEASNEKYRKTLIKPTFYYQATEAGIKAVLAALAAIQGGGK